MHFSSNLHFRYSSDETDDDLSTNTSRKKKPSANSRRQTMANPMPPPPPAAAPAPIAVVPRSPNKRRTQATRNSEPKESAAAEYDDLPSSSSSRSVTKTIQKKVTRTYKSSASADGLETGSDSDIPEEPEKTYYSNKSYDSRARDRNSAEVDQTAKLYENRPKPMITPKADKYVVPPFKPNISPILPVREEPSYKKDDLTVNDILANYETPYLSEFTRRLSTRASINLPAPPRSTVKSQ